MNSKVVQKLLMKKSEALYKPLVSLSLCHLSLHVPSNKSKSVTVDTFTYIYACTDTYVHLLQLTVVERDTPRAKHAMLSST